MTVLENLEMGAFGFLGGNQAQNIRFTYGGKIAWQWHFIPCFTFLLVQLCRLVVCQQQRVQKIQLI